MLEPVRPEAVLPDRALCLPTFSHFVIVSKTPFSLSLSSPPHVRSGLTCEIQKSQIPSDGRGGETEKENAHALPALDG